MSTIDQYEVYDALASDTVNEWARWSQDSGDPYSDMVTVFGHHLVGSFTAVDFLDVHFTVVNNGYSLSPVSAVSPGSKDFCIEMVFRLPGTYSSELFDELSAIDHPLFYTGGFTDSRATNRILLYVNNDYKPNNVGLNGLSFLCKDDDENSVLVACPAATFNWWLSSQTQYKSLAVGRRGQTFFMYANGILAATSTPTTFGEINIPGTDSCHAMVVPGHSCLTNFLSALRVTIGACRAVGDLHIHKTSADAAYWPSSPRVVRGRSLRSLVGNTPLPTTSRRRRCGSSTLFDSGCLFNFSGGGNVITKSIERIPVFAQSVIGNKRFYPFGNGYYNSFDGAFRSAAGGLYITDQSFTDFIFCVAFRPDSESVTGQLLLKVLTAGPYPTPRKRMQVTYSDGDISILIQTVDSGETPTATHVDYSMPAQPGDGKSFVVGRSSEGFFFIVDGSTYTISYTGFDAVKQVYLGYSCADCEIDEFYYRESGVSQTTLEGYAEFFTTLSAEDVAVSAVDDTGECANDSTASGNVLASDVGRFMRVSKVGGSAGNVGVAVAGSAGGLFTIDADGSWAFDTDGDFGEITEDTDTSVAYHVSDGATEDEGLLTVTVVAEGASLWTPANTTTVLWLDAADSDTITLDSGKVSQWSDKSGNSRHVAQSTAASRPVVTSSAQNSLDVLTFDGGDVLSTSENFPETGNAEFSVFWVSKKTAAGGSVFGWGGYNTGLQCIGWYDDGAYSQIAYSGGHAYNSAALSTGDFSSWSYVKAAGAINSTSMLTKNGADAGTSGHSTSTPNISSNKFYVGQWANYTTGARLVGSIAELIVFPVALSVADRQIVEGYLAHKWGLVASLPSGHPYKSSAPTT